MQQRLQPWQHSLNDQQAAQTAQQQTQLTQELLEMLLANAQTLATDLHTAEQTANELKAANLVLRSATTLIAAV